LPIQDFSDFSNRAAPEYKDWHQLKEVTIGAAGRSLKPGKDLKGVYSIGKSIRGLVRVLVWDEESETLVAALASGIL